MKIDDTGQELLSDLQKLELRLQDGGRETLVSLIDACIEDGWNSVEAILAKVEQIGGPYYRKDVLEILEIHSSPIARPQLWTRCEHGIYRQRPCGFRAEDLDFWRPAEEVE